MAVARRGTARAVPKSEAQAKVIQLIAAGSTVADAMAAVDRKEETYRDWMREAEFKRQISAIRDGAKARAVHGGREPIPDFATFCQEWLRQPLYDHQLRFLDLLEGREPRDLHYSMRYVPGRHSRLVANFPPEHAKTTSFAINYVVWLIHKDPNIKVAIVSKNAGMAKKMLGAIKDRLTNPVFAEMHRRFSPNGEGWRDPDNVWASDQIMVAGRTSGAKDPTVQALGLRSQIYSARIDFLILDDVVDDKNVGELEGQLNWLTQMALTRLPSDVADEDEDAWEFDEDERENRVEGLPYGTCAVLGTRIAARDLYKELRDNFVELSGEPLWTYLSQPAVLEYAEDPKDWVTLWPHTVTRKGRKRAKWAGPQLAGRRGDMGTERRWALVYQQQDVAEDATFPPELVQTSINGRRLHGPMKPGAVGHRDEGMNGLYVIGALDPAASGYTAMVVGGVERFTKKRYVLELVNQANMGTTTRTNRMKELTLRFGINEWIIEKNAFQGAILTDEELKQWMYAHGSRMTAHTTGANKHDPDLGVMSLAPLFESCAELDEDTGKYRRRSGGGLIELPSRTSFPTLSQLIEQLVTWVPSDQMPKGQKTDLVMALWFFDLAARKHIGVGVQTQTHLSNPWLTRRDRARQRVVPLSEFQQLAGASA